MSNFSKFFVIGAVLMLSAAFAFGQTSETLNIGGTVPLVLTLDVTQDETSQELALFGTTADVVADIAEISVDSNNHTGWTLTLTSANAGAAETNLASPNGVTVPYQVIYDGGAATALTNAGLEIDASATDTAPSVGRDVDGKVLQITYDQSNDLTAGYYSDQLTLTLRTQ